MSEALDQARLEALVAELKKVAPFADQPQADLEWFVAQSEELNSGPGARTARRTAPSLLLMLGM